MINKIPSEALAGCTFTVTELMGEGVTVFTLLINRFQFAIFGVSAKDPSDGFMEFSITFDHRVTEGRQVAKFLKELQALVELSIMKT